MDKIDKLDKKILAILSTNARMAYREPPYISVYSI